MKVRSSFKGGVATLFLDVRNQDGSLDRAAWRAIQTDHDKGWQQVGLWALRFKGFQRDLNSALDWHFDPCPYVATFSVRAMQMPDVLVRPKTGVLQKKVPVSENPKTLGSRQSPLLTQALNEAKGINALRSAFRLMCASSSSGKVQNETVNKEAVRHVVIAVLNRMQSGQERSRYAVDKAMSVSWCFQILGIANPLIQHRIAEMTGANALVYERVDSERYPTYYIYTHLDRLRVHEFLSWAYEAGIRNEELTDVISQSQGGDISKDGEETTSNETDTTASRDEGPETEETREPPKSLSEIRREIAANNRGTSAQVKESNESKFVLSIENGVATGSIRLSPTQLRELNGPRTDVLHRYRNWGFRYLRYKGYIPCDVNSFQPIWNDSHKRLEFVAEVRPMADGEIGVEQRGPTRSHKNIEMPVPESTEDIALLKETILRNYPDGIVLNNASIALLQRITGKHFEGYVVSRVRSEMFARADGTLLYPEMVMGMDGLERMKNRAKELLSEYGMFAYGCLCNEFAGEMRNLSDEKDFARFFDRFFGRDVGMVYASRDRLGKMMCLGEIQDVAETVGEKVRGALAECGDAVSIDNLLLQLPYLSREVIECVGQEVLHDVVVFDVEGERYLKLLESYFLPDDFSHVVSDFVTTTEASQGVVSIVLLEAEFESRYGEGFRVNYALEDESVFKQVVLMSFRGGEHNWNRDMFLPYGKRGNSNVAEMFLQSHQDLFHEEDFFKYALESRGLHNTGMLILTFLRKHCIRMSREWWISLDGFDRKFELSDDQYDVIGRILNDSVGNGRFKSIIELGEDVYEQLPVLQSGEKTYPWNPYILTSVAVQKVRNARVVNDEPSPYTVTAMILPLNSGEIGDVVDYVLRTFPKGYFVDAEAAFDYLRVNHIRLTKTKKLIAKIKALLEMP